MDNIVHAAVISKAFCVVQPLFCDQMELHDEHVNEEKAGLDEVTDDSSRSLLPRVKFIFSLYSSSSPTRTDRLCPMSYEFSDATVVVVWNSFATVSVTLKLSISVEEIEDDGLILIPPASSRRCPTRRNIILIRSILQSLCPKLFRISYILLQIDATSLHIDFEVRIRHSLG